MPIQTAIDSISQNQGSPFGFKNRIINGGMVIDQRNAGASVTASDSSYSVDRFPLRTSQSSKYTAQQNAGSVTPPPGFTNYLGITSSSAYTPLSTDYIGVQHKIEGYNIADFDLGRTTAKTWTLSFWVRSSLTGTFAGSHRNSAQDRSYVFTYTINQANTWEFKSITIAGDKTGTWLTTNGMGLDIWFNLGSGSAIQGTPGVWSAAGNLSAAGTVNIVSTNAATWYITGVQLELGSQATSFDYRPYGTELALCQRYYSSVYVERRTYISSGAQYFGASYNFPVPMRATPSASSSVATYNNTGSQWQDYTVINNLTGRAQTASSTGGDAYIFGTFYLSAEL